jgi:hypothetical protein
MRDEFPRMLQVNLKLRRDNEGLPLSLNDILVGSSSSDIGRSD